MDYPKILILNNYSFNEHKGGGITLKNLFIGWPKDRIAIAHLDESKPMTTVCERYYKIGYNECHYVYPLNKLSTEPRGRINGPYKLDDYDNRSIQDQDIMGNDEMPDKNRIKQWLLEFIDRSGVNEFIHPLDMSVSLKEWILEYEPDIIYCQPENISFINLVLKAQKITGARLVVHIMDDWPFLVYKNKALRYLLRAIVRKRFNKLLTISSLRLGISEVMATEFQSRYGLPFKFFHNPVDLSVIDDLASVSVHSENSCLVVYSGRIGITASYNSITAFCKGVAQLRQEGLNVKFNLYTDINNKEINFSDFAYDGTNLLPVLDDGNYMSKLIEADLLLYPVDFDKRSIEFIRLSFPTKLPSYFASGIPILCYGPSEVYSVQFMKNNKLGFLCDQQAIGVLKESIIDALTNISMRENYSKAAFEYAKSHFDIQKVRSAFHQELASC